MADKQLLDVVTTQLAAGATDDQLRETLAAKGWDVGDINGAIAIARLQASPIGMRDQLRPAEHIKRFEANTALQAVLILIMLAAAPGAYGLITAIIVPAVKGQPVAVNKSLNGYDLLKDVPGDAATLIPTSAGSPIKSLSSSGGSHVAYEPSSTVGVAPAATPTAPAPSTVAVADTDVPQITLTASPTTVASGDKVTISWNATNATACNGTGFQTYSKTSGSVSISIYSASTYSISCLNNKRLANQSVSVAVAGVSTLDTGAVPPPPTDPGSPPIPIIPPAPAPPPPPAPAPAPAPAPGGPADATTPAQIVTLLNAAKGGETFTLAAGDYGDFTIRNYHFPSQVTLVSATPGNPAVFRTLSIITSSNVGVNRVAVHITPNATTASWTPVVQIVSSQNITLTNSNIRGGMPVNGTPADATARNTYDTVTGYPCSYAVVTNKSSNVLVQGNDVTLVDRGITVGGSQNVTIKNNEVHNIRRTGILGAGNSYVYVDGNYVHDSNPWRWGQTPLGDHGDYLAMWTDPASQSGPSTDIHITNNRFEQGSGQAILGMWFQGNYGSLGFANSEISHNLFVTGHGVGILFSYVWDTTIDHNVFIRSELASDPKSAPFVRFSSVVKRVSVTNNFVRAISDVSGSTGTDANTTSGNVLVQRDDPKQTGYYDLSIVSQIEGMSDTNSAYALMQSKVTGPLVFGDSRRLLASVLEALNAFLRSIGLR